MSTHNQNFTSIDPLFTKNYYLFIGKGYKLSYGAVEFRKKKRKKGGEICQDSRVTTPTRLAENDHLQSTHDDSRGSHHRTVNHALITRSQILIQIYVPVSLEIKDTVVRSYRTDPVQVRS
uniref:Uncharacterized protein n=1 Tax=Medicago truncatula TaxID=3880 RepID=A2Q5R0_MEDTR|nr:hypothetical protein MtrDRAFT_AC167711g28v2 [Medicago truncatula]